MPKAINKEFLKPVCRKALEKEEGFDYWNIMDDDKKGEIYRFATQIILEWEAQRVLLKEERDT